MKPLLLLAAILTHAGCSVAVTPDSPAPFANSVRFADLTEQQAESAASTVTEVRSTNTLLGELVEQQKIAAGQQCDLLKELVDLKAAIAPVPAPPAPAPTVSAPPLWTPESDEGIPVGATITVGGKSVGLAAFIAQWYRVPWSYPGLIDDHLKEHGVNLSGAGLSTAIKERLHAAIHEREAQGKVDHGGTEARRKIEGQPVVRPVPKSLPPAVAQPAIRSPCPGGVCPAPSRQVYPQPVRRGLFGRIRR